MKLKRVIGSFLMVTGTLAIATFAVMGAIGYDATFCFYGILDGAIALGLGAIFLISSKPRTVSTDDMNA